MPFVLKYQYTHIFYDFAYIFLDFNNKNAYNTPINPNGINTMTQHQFLNQILTIDEPNSFITPTHDGAKGEIAFIIGDIDNEQWLNVTFEVTAKHIEERLSAFYVESWTQDVTASNINYQNSSFDCDDKLFNIIKTTIQTEIEIFFTQNDHYLFDKNDHDYDDYDYDYDYI